MEIRVDGIYAQALQEGPSLCTVSVQFSCQGFQDPVMLRYETQPIYFTASQIKSKFSDQRKVVARRPKVETGTTGLTGHTGCVLRLPKNPVSVGF